jgi:polyvinyl alcohol dehydrogenase (cytochrome)
MRNLSIIVGSLLIASSALAADWPMYGFDVTNSRFNASETKITRRNVAALHKSWTFATGAPVSVTPIVSDGSVYFGSWDHAFYAVDAKTGALQWRVTVATPQGDSEGPFPGIQSSALVDGGKVYFGDSCGYLHAYPADGSGAQPTTMTTRNRGCGSTGTEVTWFPVDLASNLSVPADAPHTDLFSSPIPFTPTTGPNADRRMIYIGAASHLDNPCIRGAEFALDAGSGALVWRFDAVPTTAIGAGVWSSAAIDAANDLVYIDTGDCVTTASAGFAESIIALDASCSGVSLDASCPDLPAVVYPTVADPNVALAKNNPVWAFAAHPNGEEADLDFGSTPNIFTVRSGQLLVGAGGKDGSYYAVSGGRSGGREVWTTRIVDEQTPVTTISIGNSIGSAAGGFIGSTGAAYGKIFGTTVSGPEFEVALATANGRLIWDGLDALSSLAPVAIANRLVFSADAFGFFKARDQGTGLLKFVAFIGNSVSSGPSIANGMIYVGSGLPTASLSALPLPNGVTAFAP